MTVRFKDYPSLLEAIRKRPQIWLGGKSRSASLLSSFLSGIEVAEYFHGISKDSCIGGFNWKNFETWAANKFNPKRLPLNSLALASFLAKSETEAFDLWYSWYDQYSQERG